MLENVLCVVCVMMCVLYVVMMGVLCDSECVVCCTYACTKVLLAMYHASVLRPFIQKTNVAIVRHSFGHFFFSLPKNAK